MVNLKELYVSVNTYRKMYYVNFLVCFALGLALIVFSKLDFLNTDIRLLYILLSFFVPIAKAIVLFISFCFAVSFGIAICYMLFNLFVIIFLRLNILKTVLYSQKIKKVLKSDSRDYQRFFCNVFAGTTVFVAFDSVVLVVSKKHLNATQRKHFDEVQKPKVQKQLSFLFGQSIAEVEETDSYYYLYI